MLERQVVIFVRVNNMETLETEAQKTFVIDVSGITSTDYAIGTALIQAVEEWGDDEGMNTEKVLSDDKHA